MDDPRRGTGRTTAGLLNAFAMALLTPDSWVAYVDHDGCAPLRLLNGAQWMAGNLRLKLEFEVKNDCLMVRSPINRLIEEGRSKSAKDFL